MMGTVAIGLRLHGLCCHLEPVYSLKRALVLDISAGPQQSAVSLYMLVTIEMKHPKSSWNSLSAEAKGQTRRRDADFRWVIFTSNVHIG